MLRKRVCSFGKVSSSAPEHVRDAVFAAKESTWTARGRGRSPSSVRGRIVDLGGSLQRHNYNITGGNLIRCSASAARSGRGGGRGGRPYIRIIQTYPDISRIIQSWIMWISGHIQDYPLWICLDMFGEWGYPDNPGLSRIIQILDNPGYVWIYPDNTRLRNGGGGGGRGGGADAEHRIKLPPEKKRGVHAVRPKPYRTYGL